jgi:PAS domain S-box-containing protein
MNDISSRHFRDYAMTILIVAAVLVIIASVYIHMVQAFLPMAALLLVLHIYLFNKDGNIRWISGVLSFGFGMSMLSNFCWYLLPGYLAPALGLNDLVNWYYYYYVTGIFWMIGYLAIAYVLLQMVYSRQWYLERRIDRMITVAAGIAICLTVAYVLLNLDWHSKYLLDIFILLIFLCLDIVIASTALKMSLSVHGELRYLAMSVLAFFSMNAVADLLFETRWLFRLSTLITINQERVDLSFHIRDLIDITYNSSLLIMTGLLFLFVLDPFTRRTLDEMRGRLEDTQLFMDDLIARSPDATCIFDRNGQLVLVNDPFLQIFGLKRKDLDRSFNIFSHIGMRLFNEETYAEILKVRDRDTVIIPKLKLKTIPEGRQERSYLYLKMFPTCGSDGRVSNYVMIIEDITVRMEMETALRQSEEKFRVLAETSPAAICLFRDTQFIYVNPAVERISGYSREEFAKMELWELLTPEYRLLLQERLAARKIGKPMPSNYELCIVNKSKALKWVSISIGSVSINGEPAFIVSAFDATERKQAEEALRASEASLAKAQIIAHIGSWEWDIGSNNGRWSDELYYIFGLDRGSFVPSFKSFLSRVHPDDRTRVEDEMRAALHECRSYNLDSRILRPDGSERTLHCEGEVAYDNKGKPVRMIGTAQDITERIRLEKELLNTYHSLKEAYERKIDFTNAAAHELRTPLTPIIGYTDILKSEVKDERHLQFLDIIERNALRQKTLVNRMLELASLDAGMAHVSYSEMELRPLAVEIADNYRAINPNIRVEVPEGMFINTDLDIMRHVLDNLVSNAVKFSDNQKEIVIRVAEAGDNYQFSVKDQGAGIPREEWGKIFERFYIVGGESDSRTSGRSGLGLALVKAYIRLIGGNVWLESNPGQGSTFYFTVPRKPSSGDQRH